MVSMENVSTGLFSSQITYKQMASIKTASPTIEKSNKRISVSFILLQPTASLPHVFLFALLFLFKPTVNSCGTLSSIRKELQEQVKMVGGFVVMWLSMLLSPLLLLLLSLLLLQPRWPRFPSSDFQIQSKSNESNRMIDLSFFSTSGLLRRQSSLFDNGHSS